MIGTDCYEAALGYVRRKAVGQQMWIPGQNALFGVVHGRYGEFYTPTVYFSGQGPMLEVRGAQCSCDARYACEHAAALLVSAVEGGADTAGMPTVPRQARRPPSWDTSLESLLAAGHDAGRPGETMLAIELTLVAEPVPAPASAEAPIRPRTGGRPAAGPAAGAADGPPGAARQERRLDRRHAELGQARQLRLLRRLSGHPGPVAAGAARAVPDPRQPALLLPRRTFYRAVRVRVGPALAAARRGRASRPAAGVRTQARRGGAVPRGAALPGCHPGRGRRGPRHRAP